MNALRLSRGLNNKFLTDQVSNRSSYVCTLEEILCFAF